MNLEQKIEDGKKKEKGSGDSTLIEKIKLEETTYKHKRQLSTALNCLIIIFIFLFGLCVTYYLVLTAYPPLLKYVNPADLESAKTAKSEIGEIILKVLSFIAGGVIGKPILNYFKTSEKF